MRSWTIEELTFLKDLRLQHQNQPWRQFAERYNEKYPGRKRTPESMRKQFCLMMQEKASQNLPGQSVMRMGRQRKARNSFQLVSKKPKSSNNNKPQSRLTTALDLQPTETSSSEQHTGPVLIPDQRLASNNLLSAEPFICADTTTANNEPQASMGNLEASDAVQSMHCPPEFHCSPQVVTPQQSAGLSNIYYDQRYTASLPQQSPYSVVVPSNLSITITPVAQSMIIKLDPAYQYTQGTRFPTANAHNKITDTNVAGPFVPTPEYFIPPAETLQNSTGDADCFAENLNGFPPQD